MKTFPPGSPQADQLALKRILEVIAAINNCLPTTSGVQDATAGLVNACTDLTTGQSVLDLQLQAAICWLGNGGAATNCNRPWPCDYLTVLTAASINDLYLWDAFAPGFLIPDAVTSNGSIYFAPTGSVSAYPMVFCTTVSLPKLTSVAGDLVCVFHPQIVSFSAPVLTHVGGKLLVGSNASVESLDLSSIVDVGGDMDVGAQLLVNVALSTLASVGGNLAVGGNLVQTVNIDGLTSFDGDFSCELAALTQEAVNYLLVRMDELNLTNHLVNLSGGTSASPSGAGLTAKSNLEGRGCTVQVN